MNGSDVNTVFGEKLHFLRRNEHEAHATGFVAEDFASHEGDEQDRDAVIGEHEAMAAFGLRHPPKLATIFRRHERRLGPRALEIVSQRSDRNRISRDHTAKSWIGRYAQREGEFTARRRHGSHVIKDGLLRLKPVTKTPALHQKPS
jgi:hypothetical protein